MLVLTGYRYARVIDDKREVIGYDRSSANLKLPKVES
jgi:hypothetical protein